MNRYLLNKIPQSNGDYEVHKATCYFKPTHYFDLGYHYNCHDAIRHARAIYSNIRIDGCTHCSRECHSS
jgi:hypothetical protein